MPKIIKLNIGIILAYLISYFLSLIDFSYSLYAVGLLIFFLPGLNLSLILEQISQLRQGRGKIFLWTFLFSLILTPTIIWIFSSSKNQLADEQFTLLVFIIWWAISFLILIIFFIWKKFEPTNLQLPIYQEHKAFYWSLIIFTIVITIHLTLYPFIPEADGYVYLVKLKNLFKFKEFIEPEARPLFLTLLWTLNFLSKISVYWILKIIFPFLGLGLVTVFYQIAKKFLSNSLILILASISFLYFPVIIIELIIPRPQTIFLVTLPILLYLLCHLLKHEGARNLYWWVFLFIATLLAVKIHETFFLAIVFVIIAFLVWVRVLLIERKIFLSMMILLVLGSIFYFWLKNSEIIAKIIKLSNPFWQAILSPKFDFWFIDNYTNTSGNKMGWPGFSWLFYYGYNLGIIFPTVLIIALIKKIKIYSFLKKHWIWLVYFLLFFAIAEIFPRIGTALFPDRAWLFVSLFLAFLTILIFQTAKNKIILILITILAVISIFLSWGLTYAKQGWVSAKEYQAAIFLKNNIPKNAVIISQKGNIPMIDYFTDRLLVKPEKQFFIEDDIEQDLNFIQNLPEFVSKQEKILNTKNKLEENMRKKLEQFFIYQKKSTRIKLLKQLNARIKQHNQLTTKLQSIEKQKLNQKRPVYILYSEEKFKNLYSQREWWKEVNFYNANLKKFDCYPEYFEKIYDQDGIKIWKVK